MTNPDNIVRVRARNGAELVYMKPMVGARLTDQVF